MAKAKGFHPGDAGCWFDSHRGVYIGQAVIALAIERGWQQWGEGRAEKSCGGLTPDDEEYYDAWLAAEDYLASLAPSGYWIGGNENGDFGMWEIEEEGEQDG